MGRESRTPKFGAETQGGGRAARIAARTGGRRGLSRSLAVRSNEFHFSLPLSFNRLLGSVRTMKKKFSDFALAGLFTALILVATAYLPRIPIGSGGYIHVGDAVIYLAASFLPKRLAMAAGGLGGALADLLSGFALWAPFTLVIKMGLVLPFTGRSEKLLCARNIAAPFAAFPVTVGGYYVAEWILTGSASVPAVSLPYNALQAAGSAALYFFVAARMDRARIKKRLRPD
jgi:uncharacterized repeat protein (TIGR04002 family)